LTFENPEHPGQDTIKIIMLLGLERACKDRTDTNIVYITRDNNPNTMIIQATVQVSIPFARYNADGYTFFAC